jgi:hypothetical protein
MDKPSRKAPIRHLTHFFAFFSTFGYHLVTKSILYHLFFFFVCKELTNCPSKKGWTKAHYPLFVILSTNFFDKLLVRPLLLPQLPPCQKVATSTLSLKSQWHPLPNKWMFNKKRRTFPAEPFADHPIMLAHRWWKKLIENTETGLNSAWLLVRRTWNLMEKCFLSTVHHPSIPSTPHHPSFPMALGSLPARIINKSS